MWMAAVVAGLAALPLVPWALFLAGRTTPMGLRVEHEPLPPTEAPARALAPRVEAWLDAPVRVSVGDALGWHTRRELGARLDVDALERRALTLGRSGRPWRDLPELWSAWAGSTHLRWRVYADEAAVRAFVRAAAREHDRAPQAALVDARGRRVRESAPGRSVRRAEAVRVLSAALRRGSRALVLPVQTLAPPPAPPPPPPEPTRVQVARYATRLRTHGGERARAHNVRTAAGYLDGALIPPRGELSFNRRVGPRDRARGYRDAHVIVGGEMVDGIGGGVCQVASTLHAAAFLGGLDVVRHVPHSRPSEYIPMGLDATVVWPSVDLVLSNPFTFPLEVRARLESAGEGTELVVELWGAARVARVEWRTEILATESWADRFVEDPSVPAGAQRVSQRGIRGFRILRERTVEDHRGIRVEQRRIEYPPTDRIVRVAPSEAGGAELAGAIGSRPW